MLKSIGICYLKDFSLNRGVLYLAKTLLFFISLIVFNLALGDNLTYICASEENILVKYSSDPSSLESRIDLNYKKQQLELVYEPALVDSKYTIYANLAYEWWEFIEEETTVAILFERKIDGNILEICDLENLDFRQKSSKN